jgi:hypothetical protein
MIHYQINNKPYLDLEPYIDMKGLVSIEKDIIMGIVKSKQYMQDDGCNTYNTYDKTYESIVNSVFDDVIKNPKNENYEYYKELNFDVVRCKMFNRYLGKYTQMGQLMNLRTWWNSGKNDVRLKNSQEHNVDRPAYANFPSLKEWVNNLKIFDEIGRIIFWFNAPGESHTIHRDTYLGYPDHFLLINLHPENKDLFLLDTDGEKVVIPSRAFCFDIRNYHGTQGKDFYSWTFRIDGKFNKEWLESIGHWDYFNPAQAKQS